MTGWRTPIFCYVSPAGNNKITDWYNQLSIQEQTDASAFLKFIRKKSATEWKMPLYRFLGGGLGELRWESCDKQQRLLGFFQNGKWYAVVGCTHKGKIYKPPKAMETAMKYMGQIEADKAITHEYDLE